MRTFICGIDIGGTFTDCVLVDDQGHLATAKAPSTPPNFGDGLIATLEIAAGKLGLAAGDLLGAITTLSHGTTVGTNAVIQKRGSTIGLITTMGHNDVIHIMRGSRGLSGHDIQLIVHFPESRKPDPIVPKRLIEGVSERIDCFGNTVVELNEDEARAAIVRLRDEGVEAIAICFLWSFLRPAHEQRVKRLAAELAPDLFVTCSTDLAPKWGEYERTAAVALNAYIGPVTTRYLQRVDGDLKAMGYRPPLQITQCGGGTISVARAIEAPLLTLDSGPVSGVTGSQFLGQAIGCANIITADMGGTSFDVGIIHDGQPATAYRSLVNQYDYFLPKVDIQTMGSGGGSQIWLDQATAALKVGPTSSGAVPGPVCYGHGGTVPTVTDADLVLGYLDPLNFAGGSMQLDRAAAAAALEKIAAKLGMDLYALASGVAQIVEFQMADLIRRVTIQKGFDPRDFVLFAFGGAGPVHMGVAARELGIERVIVPQGDTAAVWCAFGAASADILHVYEQVQIMSSPFEGARINEILGALEARGRRQLESEGVAADDRRFAYSLDLRHHGQINEVEVDIPGEMLSEHDLEALPALFVERYESLYGRGAALPGARLEIVTFRCRASGATATPSLVAATELVATPPDDARRPDRSIYWAEWRRPAPTAIFDGHRLRPGNTLAGPCIVETATTSVVVHPGQHMAVDPLGNFVLALERPATADDN